MADVQSAFGLSIPRTLEDLCNPSEMALLVYDMQIGIVRQLEDGPAIVDRVCRVLEAARAASMRVFFTRHMSLPLELMGAFQYRMAMAWQHVDRPEGVRPRFLRGSPEFELVPQLGVSPREAILDKITMSAFEGTPLSIALRDCQIRSLALAGIAMEVGIEPTARHAADLGIVPVIIEDACGHGDPEASARSVAGLRFAGDALFTDVEGFTRMLGSTNS
jgi:nicotinamidase-related amidase